MVVLLFGLENALSTLVQLLVCGHLLHLDLGVTLLLLLPTALAILCSMLVP